MRCIVHISDLHFGHNDPLLVQALQAVLPSLHANVVVISGDLVEHATEQEFRDAGAYLQTLPGPQIVVPGNHDLAFYNLWRRTFEGLQNYRRYITDDLTPRYMDEELAVLGVRSAHLYPVKGGKITDTQLNDIIQQFSTLPKDVIRVLVTHHPFDLPEPGNPHLLIGHSRRAVEMLAPVVDILLAGHVHHSSFGSTSTRYGTERGAMVFVQAGTAVSSRYKGEANSFNVIQTCFAPTGEKEITVQTFAWSKDDSRFQARAPSSFRLGQVGWAALP